MKKLILLTFVIALSNTATAWSQQVIRGPYLQQQSDAHIIVKWSTDTSTDSVVRYGQSPGNLTNTTSMLGGRTDHSVPLMELDPSTEYFYSVGTSGATIAGDSSYHFRTSPVPGIAAPTRVWVIGDSGTASPTNNNARNVRDAYKSYAGSNPADLWIMLGDNAYNDGLDEEYQVAVFDTYPEILRQTVLWPTLGNHDGHSADSFTGEGPYYDIFELPTNGESGGAASGTEAYYSFNHGNIHFINLDSYDTDRSPGGDMMLWLQDDLAANTQPWVIAFWHHPPYTKGSHNSDTEGALIDMRQNALPILESWGVDLVMSGHSHSYERSMLIDGHYGFSTSFDIINMAVDAGDGNETGVDGAYEKPSTVAAANAGAVYAVAGSSGKISGGNLNHPVMSISLNSLGSMVLDINGNEMDAVFLDQVGTIRDQFTIRKTPDVQAPVLLSASATDSTTVDVEFSERLNADLANDIGNYSIDNGVNILDANLNVNGITVTLATSTLSEGIQYLLTVNNIQDKSGNVIATNSQADFEFVNLITLSFQEGVAPDSSYAGTDDAYIREASPNTAHGLESSLQVDGDEPSGAGQDMNILLRWDLGQVPASSIVDSAAFELEVTNVSSGPYYCYQLVSDWQEGQVTWNQASTGISWSEAGAAGASDRDNTVLCSISAGTTGQLRVDFNTAGLGVIQSWVDGTAPNNGILIGNTSISNGADFHSSESSVATVRPLLEMVYSTPDDTGNTELHASDISMGLTASGKKNHRATALISVVDQSGVPQSGVTVNVNWSGLVSDVQSGITNESGEWLLTSSAVRKRMSGEFRVTIDDVSRSGDIYDDSANIESTDCINNLGGACAGGGGNPIVLELGPVQVDVGGKGKNRKGTATVVILDESGQPTSSATVNGQWDVFPATGGSINLGSSNGTTDSSGTASLTSAKDGAKSGDVFRFTLSGVTHPDAESPLLGGQFWDSPPVP